MKSSRSTNGHHAIKNYRTNHEDLWTIIPLVNFTEYAGTEGHYRPWHHQREVKHGQVSVDFDYWLYLSANHSLLHSTRPLHRVSSPVTPYWMNNIQLCLCCRRCRIKGTSFHIEAPCAIVKKSSAIITISCVSSFNSSSFVSVNDT